MVLAGFADRIGNVGLSLQKDNIGYFLLKYVVQNYPTGCNTRELLDYLEQPIVSAMVDLLKLWRCYSGSQFADILLVTVVTNKAV